MNEFLSHNIVLLDLNEFSSIFCKVQHSQVLQTSQKIASNCLRITLIGRLRVIIEQSLEGALYINIWQNSPGPPEKNLVSCKLLKIWMISDRTVHKAFRIHNILFFINKTHWRFFSSSLFGFNCTCIQYSGVIITGHIKGLTKFCGCENISTGKMV